MNNERNIEYKKTKFQVEKLSNMIETETNCWPKSLCLTCIWLHSILSDIESLSLSPLSCSLHLNNYRLFSSSYSFYLLLNLIIITLNGIDRNLFQANSRDRYPISSSAMEPRRTVHGKFTAKSLSNKDS